MKTDWLIKVLTLCILVFSFGQKSACAQWDKDISESVNIDGINRHYIVHLPSNFDPNKSYALVIMLHGGGGNSQAAMEETGWAEKANQEGFIVVFPDGSRPFARRRASFALNPPTWNDGSGRFNSGKRNVDDIAFIRALINNTRNRFHIDSKRVYLTGFSNGASMAFRAAIELADSIAAVAPVSGALWYKARNLSSPVSLIYITGASDSLNPLSGGQPKIANGKVLSEAEKPAVQESINTWIKLIGCPEEVSFAARKNGVMLQQWKNPKQNLEVLFYTIDDLGHVWPGGKALLPERMVGKSSNKVNATDVIWQFFELHPKI